MHAESSLGGHLALVCHFPSAFTISTVRMPRQYHLVWSGTAFPAAYQLAVRSILDADELATVRIHVIGEPPTVAAFTDMAGFDRVRMEDVDPQQLFGLLPAPLQATWDIYDALPTQAASARSNLIRYALLALHGGVYVDFDAIVLRPLHDLSHADAFLGLEQVWSGDAARVEGRWRALIRPRHGVWALSWLARRLDSRLLRGRLGLARRLRPLDRLWAGEQANNAIIGARAGSEFIETVLWEAMHARVGTRYALGPTLVDRVARLHPELVETLPPAVLYEVPPGQSFRFFEDCTLDLAPAAAAMHYVGSNHGHLLAELQLSDDRFATRPEPFWALGRRLLASPPPAPVDAVL